MNINFRKIINTPNDHKIIIVRLIVGGVFLSEGIQKFLFPALVGAGRFTKIGFSNPEFWAYFVAVFEIVCGSAVIAGLLTRLAAFPLLIIMCTALITTKVPILLEKGFWSMAHDSRTDFAMTGMLIFLFIAGSGKWSVDSVWKKTIE